MQNAPHVHLLCRHPLPHHLSSETKQFTRTSTIPVGINLTKPITASPHPHLFEPSSSSSHAPRNEQNAITSTISVYLRGTNFTINNCLSSSNILISPYYSTASKGTKQDFPHNVVISAVPLSGHSQARPHQMPTQMPTQTMLNAISLLISFGVF